MPHVLTLAVTLFNHLSRLLPDIVSPVGLVIILLLLALLAGRGSRLRGTLVVSGLTILVFFSLPLTSKMLIATLEDRYPALPMEAVPEADTIILLGGAVNLPHAGLTRPELGPSGDRLALTAALWHAGKAPKILISAGNLAAPEGLSPEAVYTADILASWGVPRTAMVLETVSGNTYENARLSVEKLQQAAARGNGGTPAAPTAADASAADQAAASEQPDAGPDAGPDERPGKSTDESAGKLANKSASEPADGAAERRQPAILLVTSAFHMPRARALFCAAGLETTAVTANHWLNGTTEIGWNNWLPQAVALSGSSRVVREYLGMLVYHFLGRIDISAMAHDQPCSASQA